MRKDVRHLAARLLLTLALAGPPHPAASQGVADHATDVSVEHPLHAAGAGPLVAVDEGHNNYHTLEGRYGPFGAVLRNDGYRLASLKGRLDEAALAPVDVLVIANALSTTSVENHWKLPSPSAFDATEIKAVEDWVRDGGALFLIADHMPFAGAADELARAFGFEFDNVYAFKGQRGTPEMFSRAAGTLADHAITRGAAPGRAVDEAQSFTGSAFRAPPAATPLMTLDEGWTLLFPTEAGQFDADTPRRTATRADLRAAALEHGKGRVVVVSEAAMFSNQTVQGRQIGFGLPSARQDKLLLLNIVAWLSDAGEAK